MRFTLITLFAAASAVMAQDTIVATRSGVCEPHDDHWHCPSGVPKPTYPPNASPAAQVTPSVVSGSITITPLPASASASSHSHDDDDHDHAVTASTCEPHNDHWHCPSGVPQPSTLPSGASLRSSTRGVNASASRTAPAVSQATTGEGVSVRQGVQGLVMAVLGGIAAAVL